MIEEQQMVMAGLGIEAQEVTLADQFSETLIQPVASVEVEEPTSLPAALCDETLIQELQTIPDKMGFKIGEVAEMLGIKQYVLRYWESEFEVLRPKKASNNQRYYTRKDVENAYLIRKLLHRDRFSIEGARAALRDLKAFVKTEVRKDKDYSSFNAKIDSLQDHIDELLVDIRKVRSLF